MDANDDDDDESMAGRCCTTVSIVLATDAVDVTIRLRESIVDNVKDDDLCSLFVCSAQVVAISLLY